MDEREKIIEIIAPFVSAYGADEAIADALIAAGYRKQSDTAREILAEVSRHFGGAWLVELYKKYGVEVEE